MSAIFGLEPRPRIGWASVPSPQWAGHMAEVMFASALRGVKHCGQQEDQK